MPNVHEKILPKLKAEREIEKRRLDNWRDKTMPAYRRHVERFIQLNDEIARLRKLSRRADIAISSFKETQKPQSKWYESSPEVLRRRQIVLRNPGFTGLAFCKLFDSAKIALPERWETKFNVTTWIEAYKSKKARALIQKMISTDKKAT